MKELFRFIPPVASDYSGVCSIVAQLEDCLNILITPRGCIKPVVEIDYVDEIKKDSLFYTNLTQRDIISGFDENIIYNIESIFYKYPKKYINIINTPVPSIIGSNLKGISETLEKKLRVPVIVFNTTGFEDYPLGISEALLNIGKKIIQPAHKKKLNSVNIIGYSPLIIGNKSNLNSIRKLIEDCGIEVVSVWCNETTVESLKYASKASLNIVISAEGIKLAQYMQDEFNIPYIVDMPIGINGTIRFLTTIKNMLNMKIDKPLHMISKRYSNKKVLIIGSPLEGLGIKNCLNEDFGITETKIISLISSSRKEKKLYNHNAFSNINFVHSEYKLQNSIDNFNFNTLICDPLYYNLVHNKVTLIPLPHVGLSGREFVGSQHNYIGKEGFEYFDMNLREDV